ncbi:MAG: hypothetical protein ACHP65_01400 [Legionellales bacterium]
MQSVMTQSLVATNQLVFKKEQLFNSHWYHYGLVMLALLIAAFLVAKKTKPTVNGSIKGKIIERLPVHNKTKIVIVDYDGQKFLIADNQHSLAIQPLGSLRHDH